MDVHPWRTIATLRATNIAIAADNEQLTTENAWLLDYALEGDELLTVARDQRNRLNEQCDRLTHDASEQLGEVYRLLLEATQARDEYRKKYEEAQYERDASRVILQHDHDDQAEQQHEDEAVYRVRPASERAKRPARGKGKAE